MNKIFAEFKQFAMRGNVIDLAVGFTVGVAFTEIARSLVDDIIMPVVSLLVGRAEFSDFYILLKEGPETPGPYVTLVEAQAAGAVTINYGAFINTILTFLLVALVMFFLIRGINHLDNRMEAELGYGKTEASEPTTKKCPHCITTIPIHATRCPACTSHLETAKES